MSCSTQRFLTVSLASVIKVSPGGMLIQFVFGFAFQIRLLSSPTWAATWLGGSEASRSPASCIRRSWRSRCSSLRVGARRASRRTRWIRCIWWWRMTKLLSLRSSRSESPSNVARAFWALANLSPWRVSVKPAIGLSSSSKRGIVIRGKCRRKYLLCKGCLKLWRRLAFIKHVRLR